MHITYKAIATTLFIGALSKHIWYAVESIPKETLK